MRILRRFGRHIKEGFLGVGRHFGMSVSSSSAITITLLLVGVLLALTYNLQIATQSIESSISISALVSYDAEDEDHLKRITAELEAIEGISSVTYSSKEDEFNYYVNSNQDEDLREFYENYREDNPFHDAFIIGLDDASLLESVKTKITNIPGIDSVYDGGENTYTLVGVLANVRLFGGALVLALCLLAIYLVYNTIKITISSRKDEIWIMRSVGAKNGYIRAPFLVEGILIGLMGSLVPIALISFLYTYLYRKLEGNLFGAFFLVPPTPFLFYMAGILMAIGVVVGFLGSYISVCKYLRVRR